ncbi:bifunctional folylpolyglutamate synthase/dihydrofolate synthase [Clostridiisalibacter paucivorans]|uniref:bifunctional folylpolyglutamate synthase/dihydrofolate synthase n=1 Tax=Clostridiisalibacter paucivorans TaxID=408753 RepID=UPI00047E7729|nr:folylpolyglutamate synthase/dihydrofolate synthase family protein [Clostridiisalibacter paucivorans]
MDYIEALNFIHGTRKFGSKLGLENIKMLLDKLGNPQKDLKFIHVAGTNGKGSTAAFISNMLIQEGYKVGKFTSPYLERFNERIAIGEKDIDSNSLAYITDRVKEKVEEMLDEGYNHPTEFEIVTAIGFEYFIQEKVDFVVLEVGLGGRYDSTNIIKNPLAVVITPISMDHMDILGNTLEKIAYEKAGIIKQNSLVISSMQEKPAKETIQAVANEENGELIFLSKEDIKIKSANEQGSIFDIKFGDYEFSDLKIKLLGKHQVYNSALAVLVLNELKNRGILDISEDSMKRGLESAIWKGRLEKLGDRPKFIIDGAHNEKGAKALIDTIKNIFEYKKLILGIGMLRDKDVDSVVSGLASMADQIVITEPLSPRKLKSEALADIIRNYNSNIIIEKVPKDAVNKSLEIANEGDLIIFSGSLYLIGEIRQYYME